MRGVLVAILAGCSHPSAAPPTAPPATTCAAVADHVRDLIGAATDRADRVHAVFLARCGDDAWPESVKRCFRGEPDLHGRHRCRQQLPVTARAVLDRDLEIARLPPIDTSHDACQRFEELSQRIEACATIDTETRLQLRDTADKILASWRHQALPRREPPDANPGGIPQRREPRDVVVPRTVTRVELGTRDASDQATAQDCRLGVDTLVKLGAENCGW